MVMNINEISKEECNKYNLKLVVIMDVMNDENVDKENNKNNSQSSSFTSNVIIDTAADWPN